MLPHSGVARLRSDLLQPTGSCHRVYSFIWWLLALEFFCLLGETASALACCTPTSSSFAVVPMREYAARAFVHICDVAGCNVRQQVGETDYPRALFVSDSCILRLQ